MHRNVKRQKRISNQLEHTVRIASIVQRSIASGRSSYVEMRALSRLTSHNLRIKVQALKPLLNESDRELSEMLSKIPSAVGDGYTSMLTPNGIVREKELVELMALDSDIVTCLGIIETSKSSKEPIKNDTAALKELLEERKKFVDSLKA